MLERMKAKRDALAAEAAKAMAKVDLLNELIAEEEANTKAVEVTEAVEHNAFSDAV